MKNFKWILFGLIVLVLTVVVFRNLEATQVELVFTTLTLPLAALLSITLLIGFLMGLFASALWRVRNWRAKSRDKKHDSPPQTT